MGTINSLGGELSSMEELMQEVYYMYMLYIVTNNLLIESEMLTDYNYNQYNVYVYSYVANLAQSLTMFKCTVLQLTKMKMCTFC